MGGGASAVGEAAGDEAEERAAAAIGPWGRLDCLGRSVVRGNTLEFLRAGLKEFLSYVGVIHESMY
jgi:hypothetical protein